jgi:hypothetical protein
MDFNRNHYLLGGLVFLLLGIQFRYTESMVLTPQCTRFLAERSNNPAVAVTNAMDALVGTETLVPPKTVYPPDWLGWALISTGSVLILHSLAMKKPGG